jgi:hypothetical protein
VLTEHRERSQTHPAWGSDSFPRKLKWPLIWDSQSCPKEQQNYESGKRCFAFILVLSFLLIKNGVKILQSACTAKSNKTKLFWTNSPHVHSWHMMANKPFAHSLLTCYATSLPEQDRLLLIATTFSFFSGCSNFHILFVTDLSPQNFSVVLLILCFIHISLHFFLKV